MKIGIAISGGGYRATAFSLGMLSYLNEVKMGSNQGTLLKHVKALSTVSGGSITGMTYSLAQKKGVSFQEYSKNMCQFMLEHDLIAGSVMNLVKPGNPNSLIESIGAIYDESLFNKGKYDALLPELNNPLEHIEFLCVNATDFNNGLPFRFVFQPKFMKMKIGNSSNVLKQEVANRIPLYVPLAASSCFPGGFEPIQIHKESGTIVREGGEVKDEQNIISLMDGGIADNQGIGALLLYDQSQNTKASIVKKNKPLDMFVITDVSTSDITPFKASERVRIPVIGNIKMIILFQTVLFFNILSILAFNFPFVNDSKGLLILNAIFTTVFSILSVLLLLGKEMVARLAKNTVGLGKMKKMNNLTPNATIELLKNRFSSLGLLIGSVFMKNLRNKNYNDMYSISENRSRAVNSSINFFIKEQETLAKEKFGVKKRSVARDGSEGNEQSFIKPELDLEKHDALFKISYQATHMDTALWLPQQILDYDFYKEKLPLLVNRALIDEVTNKVPIKPIDLLRTVIACGQITTCYNLLSKSVTIFNAREDRLPKEVFEVKDQYLQIYQQASKDWRAFEVNPYWLVDREGILG